MSQKSNNRREFLKNAGTAAVTAPAVAVLLSAQAKQAAAGQADNFVSGERATVITKDDFPTDPD